MSWSCQWSLMSLITGNKVDLCAKKMFEQKRFAGRHLLTFESQKLNYFGKQVEPAFWHYNAIRIW
jgi:hypothetical protein